MFLLNLDSHTQVRRCFPLGNTENILFLSVKSSLKQFKFFFGFTDSSALLHFLVWTEQHAMYLVTLEGLTFITHCYTVLFRAGKEHKATHFIFCSSLYFPQVNQAVLTDYLTGGFTNKCPIRVSPGRQNLYQKDYIPRPSESLSHDRTKTLLRGLF